MGLLMYAAMWQKEAVVPLLLEAGVEKDATDGHGYTAIMLAATMSDDTGVMKHLIAAGVDLTTTLVGSKWDGFTVRDIAHERNRKDQIPLLEAAGAKPGARKDEL